MLGSACAQPQEKQRLEEVYMPSFSRVPPRESGLQSLQTLADDWRNGSSTTFARDVLSPQGAIVVVSLGVLLLVAWDYRRLTSSRNVDLLLLITPGVLFFDAMRFFGVIRLADVPQPARLGVLGDVRRQRRLDRPGGATSHAPETAILGTQPSTDGPCGTRARPARCERRRSDLSSARRCGMVRESRSAATARTWTVTLW